MAYDCLVYYGTKEHFRVKHGDTKGYKIKNEFANGKNYINGIENF